MWGFPQLLAARASLAGRAVRASRGVERITATRRSAFTVSAAGSCSVGKGKGDLEMVSALSQSRGCSCGPLPTVATSKFPISQCTQRALFHKRSAGSISLNAHTAPSSLTDCVVPYISIAHHTLYPPA
jgi:hypothetical protein